MGKPYKLEVERLSNVYLWATQLDLDKLVSIIKRQSSLSLVSIGSGGSYTVASFHAWLHMLSTGNPSYAITPYQSRVTTQVQKRSAVSIYSSEGKNKDIIGVLNIVTKAEAEDVMVFALKPSSPLIEQANKTNWVSSVTYEIEGWEKDGYLATNSLFASCIILYRAYQQAYPHRFDILPDNLDMLIRTSLPDFIIGLNNYAKSADAPHESLMVIFGENARIASIDIESKLAESALAHQLIADFRNFAHGRHLWAEKHKFNSVALIMWSEEDRTLYEDLNQQLPATIPRLSMHLQGPQGWQIISSIWAVLKLIETLGELNKVDPGQPEVSDFGRALYMADAFKPEISKNLIATHELALARKFGNIGQFSDELRTELEEKYEAFKTGLSEVTFNNLILDYDATLCSPDNRYLGMSGEIFEPLIGLLKGGVTLGIATGRGKSIPKDFLKVIPKDLFKNIWVGLYNGSLILRMDEDLEDHKPSQDPLLMDLSVRLQSDHFLPFILKIELNNTQVTLSAKDTTACEFAWRTVNEILSAPEYEALKAVRSTHSWDIIRKETSKANLVKKLNHDGKSSLCIGDRGLWPGNDYELLQTVYSLGVDEISPLNDHCWNISPAGTKRIASTAFYLSRLEVDNGRFKFRIED